jgi:SCY1-like protein 2
LEAFVVLCGGSNDPADSNDGLDGIMNPTASKKSSSTALDKYTMQEKILPLIRGIKTKEPAVAIAALNVLRQVGGVADADFVAIDILPVLWSMSLGPLLDLKQFQSFMELIKSLSLRVEAEQTKKLQELSGTNGSRAQGTDDFMSFGSTNAFPSSNGNSDNPEIDFERLVKGTAGGTSSNPMDSGWETSPAIVTPQPLQNNHPRPAAFSWSTPSPVTASFPTGNSLNASVSQLGPTSRTVTPDMSQYSALTPSSTRFSQPLQPQSNYNPPKQQQSNYSIPALQSQSSYNAPLQPQTNYNLATPQSQPFQNYQNPSTSANWGSAAASNPWNSNNPSNPSLSSMANSMSNLSMNQRPAMNSSNSFSLPPPPGPPKATTFSPPPSGFGSLPPPPGVSNNYSAPSSAFGQAKPSSQKTGLDAYDSLI